MGILTFLYTLIISPLELLFENIFVIANRIIGNEGLSIIFLSLAVNFLVLPLYRRADELQTEEREIQIKMAPMIKHIKSTFKGDERFFMLQEYYRTNHYKPVYALKSSISIILQIPFFIAAYNLLSGMQSLQGMSFGFIPDLGREDAVLMIGSFPLNLLPVLMTLINVVSGIIYTKGHPVKEKIQVFGLAGVFLVLLYRSPSGLVFYWLMNNVFSLIKNVFSKLKDPKKTFNILIAAAGLVILVISLIRPDLSLRQKLLLAVAGIMPVIPLAAGYLKNKTVKMQHNERAAGKHTFIYGAFFMAVFSGVFIPANVINSSPGEFIDMFTYKNPILYVVNSFVLAVGFFVLWGGVFYFLSGAKTRQLMGKAMWIICGCSTVNYMFFGTKLGILSTTLQYEKGLRFSSKEYIINLLVLLAAFAVLYVICSFRSRIAKLILLAGTVALAFAGFINGANTVIVYGAYESVHDSINESSGEMPQIPLSKTGKNVIVFMLDRSIGPQFPYLLKEKPELMEKFDGFTYYPNTVSFGNATNIGAPALFGGYEYTPDKINARPSETLESKHDEALKVLPVLFDKEGYKVTVCDPPYAGYKLTPDLSIYDDYPKINKYNLYGQFDVFSNTMDSKTTSRASEYTEKTLNRNLFCFALMKSAPLIMQETLYNGGIYNGAVNDNSSSDPDNEEDVFRADRLTQSYTSLSEAQGISLGFIKAYAAVSNLDKITAASDDPQNTFLMMTSQAAHNYSMLQEPDYIPLVKVDNTAYDTDMTERYTIDGVTMRMEGLNQICSYHVNAASLIALGKWFDYLRELGVYDNTRIIIVADHGADFEQFDRVHDETGVDLDLFMPLLLVKDFDRTGFTVSDELMTNADTPSLAVSGIIDDPQNPFTGNDLDSYEKESPLKVFYTEDITIDDNHGNVFLPGKWFELEGDPYSVSSWKYIGE